jgi:hypothetical protein
MSPFLIDFANQRSPWRWDLRMTSTRLFLLMTVVALGMLVAAWQQGRVTAQEREALEAQLARLVARQEAQADQQRRRTQASSEHDALLRQAATQQGLRWEAIFRAFEGAPGARLESLQPDLASGVVKVQAHVQDVGQIRAYLDMLATSPVFMRISLRRHELPPQGGGATFHYEAVLAAPYRLPEGTPRSKP